MIVFLLVFLAIYGTLNAYCYWKIASALPARMGVRLAVAGSLALMVAAPVLARALDSAGVARLAYIYGFMGYVWLVVVMWIVSFGICFDVWNLACKGLGRWAPGAARLALSPRTTMLALCVIVSALSIWGVGEAWRIELKQVRVECPRLPAGSEPIRIVHVSDIHAGGGVGERRLRKIMSVVEQARPDVLVCTGDTVDVGSRNLDALAEILAAVRAPLGKFAVAGNHEFYHGLEGSLAFLDAAGFRVLRGESVLVGGRLRIAGVDDLAGSRMGMPGKTDENVALPAAETREATILLKHRPAVDPRSPGRFDLQLSGHTHGGQVFPFTLVAQVFWDHPHGLYRLDKGSAIHVSRGAGTWGAPLRVLARPEVVLITLIPPAAGAPGEGREGSKAP